jgi:hypothetical protein
MKKSPSTSASWLDPVESSSVSRRSDAGGICHGNADILAAEVIILPEEDHAINDLGIKGIGELGNVGTNAAVANALFNATGVRVRSLPIRLEHPLGIAAI